MTVAKLLHGGGTKVTTSGLGRKMGCMLFMFSRPGAQLMFLVYRSDVAGDMIGTTGFDYLIVAGQQSQIATVYREFNDLEFSYELGQKICFQRNNQTINS